MLTKKSTHTLHNLVASIVNFIHFIYRLHLINLVDVDIYTGTVQVYIDSMGLQKDTVFTICFGLIMKSICSLSLLELIFKCYQKSEQLSMMVSLSIYPGTILGQLTLQHYMYQSTQRSLERKSSLVMEQKLWNNLPINIRCATSVNVFKKHLKTYFLNLAFNETI